MKVMAPGPGPKARSMDRVNVLILRNLLYFHIYLKKKTKCMIIVFMKLFTYISWIRGKGPRVGPISLYSENALNLLCFYNYFGKTICMVMLSIMFSTFLVKFISPC